MGGIVWLASYPKSGNTWLRAFLANYFQNPAAAVDINALARFAPNEASRAYFERVSERPVAELTDLEIYHVRPQVQRFLARGLRRTMFFKTHCALTLIDNNPTIAPEATQGAIYVVRNPLDVAASFCAFYGLPPEEVVAALGSAAHELPTTADQVHQYLGTWSAHATGWADAPGMNPLVVRYEDLARRPYPEFARVVRFLGLPEDDARLKKAIRFSRFEVLAGQERERGFAERPERAERFFRAGRVGDYRNVLSPALVDALIGAHGEVMRRFGYLGPDGRLKA